MVRRGPKKNVALVNILCGHSGGGFARIVLDEVVAVRNCEGQITFVMRSGYKVEAVNDNAGIAAEEAWCKLMGVA